MFHPSTLGATTVFNTIILPRMKEYEERIKQIEEMANAKVNELQKKVTEKLGN